MSSQSVARFKGVALWLKYDYRDSFSAKQNDPVGYLERVLCIIYNKKRRRENLNRFIQTLTTQTSQRGSTTSKSEL